jgi:alpha-tubulin suppressor-like RCC1 family protein
LQERLFDSLLLENPILLQLMVSILHLSFNSVSVLNHLAESGDLYTWGSNEEGQLGHNDALDRMTPHIVSSVQNDHIYYVACGSNHSLCLSGTVNILSDQYAGIYRVVVYFGLSC